MAAPKKVDEHEPSSGGETEQEELHGNDESAQNKDEEDSRFLRCRAPRVTIADSSELWDLHAVEMAVGHSSRTPTYKCRYCSAGGRWTRSGSEKDFLDHLLSRHYENLFMTTDQGDESESELEEEEDDEQNRILNWLENVNREKGKQIESLEKEMNKLVEKNKKLEKAEAEKTKSKEDLVKITIPLIAPVLIFLLGILIVLYFL